MNFPKFSLATSWMHPMEGARPLAFLVRVDNTREFRPASVRLGPGRAAVPREVRDADVG
jgi:hypothetical protein